MGRKQGATTIDGWMMENGRRNDTFLTEKKNNALTGLANFHKRKISTERMLIVSSAKKEPTASYVLKVTILE